MSIIVPCYNEEKSVPLFYAETVKQETFFHEKNVEFEFIFVDDGFRRSGSVIFVYSLKYFLQSLWISIGPCSLYRIS